MTDTTDPTHPTSAAEATAMIPEVVDPSYDAAVAEAAAAPVAALTDALTDAEEEARIEAQLVADPTNAYTGSHAYTGAGALPTVDAALDANTDWNATPYSEADTDRYVLSPSGTWPPPIYIDGSQAGREERFYMEHRWHAQWSYYDRKANVSRKVYQRLQLVVGIGSVTVPVLVSVGPSFGASMQTVVTLFTIVISLCVTVATAIENVKQYGENWRTMRSAAEELAREKALYDVKGGAYRNLKHPFLLFAERCESIIDRQNGAWAALKEEQITQAQQKNDDEAKEG